MFQNLTQTNSYSGAVQMMFKSIDTLDNPPDTKFMDYIARKIFDNGHDNVDAFFAELKQMLKHGYKFSAPHINKLMDYCIRNFNVEFHQFVLTSILNKLQPTELDLVNSDILRQFSQRRLDHGSQFRLGLSRKFRSQKK